MDERRGRYRGGLVGPVILIGLGVVFLLNNLGIVSWSIWQVIFRLWPILLVAAGLDLLLGRRSVWGSLLALVLTLAALAGALWLFNAGIITGRAAATEQIQQPLGEATEARVVLNPAVGTLHVEALPESANLVEGTIYLQSGERVKRILRSRVGPPASHCAARACSPRSPAAGVSGAGTWGSTPTCRSAWRLTSARANPRWT